MTRLHAFGLALVCAVLLLLALAEPSRAVSLHNRRGDELPSNVAPASRRRKQMDIPAGMGDKAEEKAEKDAGEDLEKATKQVVPVSEKIAQEEADGKRAAASRAAATAELDKARSTAEVAAEADAVNRGVVSTMGELDGVLEKMYSQVEQDEQTFKEFRNKMLEEEVAKANVDLSWPAIRQLVQSEVDVGRQAVDNQVNQFKVDVLDLLQRGLERLRLDLKADITTGYIATVGGKGGQEGAGGDEPGSERPATRAERRHLSLQNGEVVNDAVVDENEMSNETDEDEDTVLENEGYGLNHREAVAIEASRENSSGDTPRDAEANDAARFKELGAAIREEERREIAQAKADENREMPTKKEKLDDYGQTASEALHDMQVALSGKLSVKDMKGEIYERLEELAQSHLNSPSPATRGALQRLRDELLKALEAMRTKNAGEDEQAAEAEAEEQEANGGMELLTEAPEKHMPSLGEAPDQAPRHSMQALQRRFQELAERDRGLHKGRLSELKKAADLLRTLENEPNYHGNTVVKAGAEAHGDELAGKGEPSYPM